MAEIFVLIKWYHKAVCDAVSDGLLTSPVSGLLGLAFETIASSGATPLWENLVESGAWDEQLMSFFLTRYVITIPPRMLKLIPDCQLCQSVASTI